MCLQSVFERECSGNETDTVDFENYRFEGFFNHQSSTAKSSGMSVTSGITKSQRLGFSC